MSDYRSIDDLKPLIGGNPGVDFFRSDKGVGAEKVTAEVPEAVVAQIDDAAPELDDTLSVDPESIQAIGYTSIDPGLNKVE